MFEHEYFDVYDIDNIPLGEESYLIDECFINEYEKAMVESFTTEEYTSVGYVSWIIPEESTGNTIELIWFPSPFHRFHQVNVSLPKDQIIKCVGCSAYSERPHFFVKSSWLQHLFLRQYSIFCLIDAIGVKKALNEGKLIRTNLIELRDAIDKIAEKYDKVSFISFADSLLLKSNWTVGSFRDEVSYSYEPEQFLDVVKDIRKSYKDILGLDIYAIVTQGSNEYYQDALLHVSETKNHISLNSLGIPFAQLMEINDFVSTAIKTEVHKPSELYIEEQFLHSLHFKAVFRKPYTEKYPYRNKMTGSKRYYFCIGWEQLLENLKPNSDNNK
ncbi:MAG: hypothetical protein DHS20C13_21920 [Thermodesulfobacteriota bacterium]|nr:MAG: hypothetical protein DHS20C13_21920 [Thermodesulfobacteriota bacterium]